MASENEQERRETFADICADIRERADCAERHADKTTCNDGVAMLLRTIADRLEAACEREIDEIVSAVSELREGMCLHCDLQQQCAEDEDGMPTTCNAMAKVNNFINRYKKVEARDECPF